MAGILGNAVSDTRLKIIFVYNAREGGPEITLKARKVLCFHQKSSIIDYEGEPRRNPLNPLGLLGFGNVGCLQPVYFQVNSVRIHAGLTTFQPREAGH